jgi:hypothetical protein
MLTFGAYRNEVAKRGLDAEQFPKVNREIRTALEIIAAAKSDLLLAMEAQRGALEEGRVLQRAARLAAFAPPFSTK